MLLEKPGKKCTDFGFALAFYISIGFNVSILIFGVYKYQEDVLNIKIAEADIKVDYNDIIYIASSLLFAPIFAMLWLSMMACCAQSIIKTTLITNAVFLCIMGSIAMFTGSYGFIGGIAIIFIALLSILYLWWVWNRIPFAEAILSTAIDAFKQHWSPVFIHFFMAIVAVIVALIDIASMAVTNKLFPFTNSNENNNNNITLFSIEFIQLVFLFWHCITYTKVAFATSCGVMISWLANNTVSVFKKFIQACTIHFGSICFGSLLEAIIQSLRYIANQRLRNQDGEHNAAQLCCIACAKCLLTIIGDALEYVNSYAYVYVVKENHSYLQSAKDVWNMFKKVGLASLINDDLINAPFTVGGIFILILVSLVGSYFVFIVHILNPVSIIASLIICMVIYSTMVAVLDAYVKTVFVSYAQNTELFGQYQPAYHAKITQALEQARS